MKPTATALLCMLALAAGFLAGRKPVLPEAPDTTTVPSGLPAMPPPPSPAPARAQSPGGGMAQILADAQRGDRATLRRLLERAKTDPALLPWMEEVWLARDPGHFLTELGTPPVSRWEFTAALRADAIQQWTRQDPDAAMAFVLSQPDLQRVELGAFALGELAATDLPRALRLAREERLELFDLTSIDGAVLPPDCREFIRELPETSALKHTLLRELVRDMPVTEAVREITGSLHGYAARGVIGSLIGRRPAGERPQVMRELEAFANGPGVNPTTRNQVLLAVGTVLADSDPAAAVAWAQRDLPAAIRTPTLQRALGKLEDPELRKTVEALLPPP